MTNPPIKKLTKPGKYDSGTAWNPNNVLIDGSKGSGIYYVPSGEDEILERIKREGRIPGTRNPVPSIKER